MTAAAEPVDGQWWMATVCLLDGEIIGDLAVRLTWGGRSAEIGFTFASQHWGRGYALEAAEAGREARRPDLPFRFRHGRGLK